MSRHRCEQSAVGAEIAWAIDGLQQSFERSVCAVFEIENSHQSSPPPHCASTRSPSPVCHGIIGTVEMEFFGDPSITFVE